MKTLTPRQKKIQVTRQIKAELKEVETKMLETLDYAMEKNDEEFLLNKDNNVFFNSIVITYFNPEILQKWTHYNN